MCRSCGTDHGHGIETHNGVHRVVRGLVVVAATTRSPGERVKPGRHAIGTLQPRWIHSPSTTTPSYRRPPQPYRWQIHGLRVRRIGVGRALGSLPSADGGMSSESHFCGPRPRRVHHVPDVHRCYLLEGWIRGVGLGLGAVHGTLGGPLGADGGGGQDDQIVGRTSVHMLPCSHHS